jgi:carbamoyl-phosphate synthase large subunit
VVRALRADPEFRGRIVGLAYDCLDPGIYARELVDDVYVIPYPSQGLAALTARLREIHQAAPLDVIIPNLDAELPSFIALAAPGGLLDELGIGTFLPSQELLDLRSKARLEELGRRCGIATPRTRVIAAVDDLYTIDREIPFPFWVKGVYYGAKKARSVDEAVAAYHVMVAQWGLPVIVQAGVTGEEIDIVAVGDGDGRDDRRGADEEDRAHRQGQGVGGDHDRRPRAPRHRRPLLRGHPLARPLRDRAAPRRGGEHQLLEVNPRFPAWCYLSAGAGQNLPHAVARLAAGQSVAPMRGYTVGAMFVRIALDQIATLDQLQAITTTGEIHYRHADARAPEEQ